jgi:hypothetical protein
MTQRYASRVHLQDRRVDRSHASERGSDDHVGQAHVEGWREDVRTRPNADPKGGAERPPQSCPSAPRPSRSRLGTTRRRRCDGRRAFPRSRPLPSALVVSLPTSLPCTSRHRPPSAPPSASSEGRARSSRRRACGRRACRSPRSHGRRATRPPRSGPIVQRDRRS